MLIYCVNLLVIAGLSWVVWKQFKDHMNAGVFWTGLVFKLTCGLLLGALFLEYYETGDAISYFEHAETMAAKPLAEWWDSITAPANTNSEVRAIIFTKILSVLIWLTKSDFWLSSLYFSLISFLGCLYLVFQLTQWSKNFEIPAICSFLFLPSVVFWSSGLLKESIVFGAVCFTVGIYVRYRNGNGLSYSSMVLLMVSLLTIISLKYYVAAILMPMLTFLILLQKLPNAVFGIESRIFKTLLLGSILAVPGFYFLQLLSPNFQFDQILTVIQRNHMRMLANSQITNAMPPLLVFGNDLDIAINTFYFVFSGLFRPLFPEHLNFPGIFSAIENFIVLSVGTFVALNPKRISIKLKQEFWSCLTYVLVLSACLSYSLPNFGTIARMKVYYFPFLVFLILIPLSTRLKINLRPGG